ncbi:Polycomb group protein EMBRYONIC FLOWER 2 [Bienertia sinuspersici]
MMLVVGSWSSITYSLHWHYTQIYEAVLKILEEEKNAWYTSCGSGNNVWVKPKADWHIVISFSILQSRNGDQSCRQDSRVSLSAEEETAAEESLSTYCKPVELYNILQRRAIRNVISILVLLERVPIHVDNKSIFTMLLTEACLVAAIVSSAVLALQNTGKAPEKLIVIDIAVTSLVNAFIITGISVDLLRIQMTVSLSGTSDDGLQMQSLCPMYIVLARLIPDIPDLEHSAVYHYTKARLLAVRSTEEGSNVAQTNFVLPEMNKLVREAKSGSFFILFVSYAGGTSYGFDTSGEHLDSLSVSRRSGIDNLGFEFPFCWFMKPTAILVLSLALGFGNQVAWLQLKTVVASGIDCGNETVPISSTLLKLVAHIHSDETNAEKSCLWGKVSMESLFLSWEKFPNLNQGERVEMLSTVDLHPCLLKNKSVVNGGKGAEQVALHNSWVEATSDIWEKFRPVKEKGSSDRMSSEEQDPNGLIIWRWDGVVGPQSIVFLFCFLGQKKCISFQMPENSSHMSTLQHVQVIISAEERGAKEKSPYSPCTYNNVPDSSSRVLGKIGDYII